jgi:hypothetical protein
MANHLGDSSDPAVQLVLAFQSASECHTLHRYETAFDLQADRVLRRLLSLRSRTEKMCVQNDPSKTLNLNPAAIEASLPNPGPYAASTLQQDSVKAAQQEPAYNLQSGRVRRVLSLRSRPEKNFHAERTQQDLESKPAAGFSVTVRAAILNPAPSPTSPLHEGSRQDSSRTIHSHHLRNRSSGLQLPCLGKLRNSSLPRYRRAGVNRVRYHAEFIACGTKSEEHQPVRFEFFLAASRLKIRRAETHLR